MRAKLWQSIILGIAGTVVLFLLAGTMVVFWWIYNGVALAVGLPELDMLDVALLLIVINILAAGVSFLVIGVFDDGTE